MRHEEKSKEPVPIVMAVGVCILVQPRARAGSFSTNKSAGGTGNIALPIGASTDGIFESQDDGRTETHKAPVSTYLDILFSDIGGLDRLASEQDRCRKGEGERLDLPGRSR